MYTAAFRGFIYTLKELNAVVGVVWLARLGLGLLVEGEPSELSYIKMNYGDTYSGYNHTSVCAQCTHMHVHN